MKIEQGILHMLDFESGSLTLSQKELDLEEPIIYQYTDKLLSKFADGDIKTGELDRTNEFVKELIDEDINFIDKSHSIAQVFFDCLKQAEDVPNGDLLIIQGIEQGEQPFLGIFKLNYKPALTHFVDYVDNQMVNNIIVNKTILPKMGQRIDEGILIYLETLDFHSIEKKYKMDGKKVSYLTERIFEVQSSPSAAENIKIVKKAVQKVADKYNEEKYESFANVQQAIYDSIEEEGKIVNERIAEAVFENNHSAKQEYLDYVERTNFKEDVPTNVAKFEKKYSKQKLKLANGIEITVPIELYWDKEIIEFINNPDGTISVMIKNVEEIMNKF